MVLVEYGSQQWKLSSPYSCKNLQLRKAKNLRSTIKTCHQTLVAFTDCPCQMTRIDTCRSIQHKEEHEWHHLEHAPDFRDCSNLKIFEEVGGGSCQMAPDGTCPFAGGETMLTERAPGDGKGRWDGDDFELPRGWDS
jgi:hypothetical protein